MWLNAVSVRSDQDDKDPVGVVASGTVDRLT